MQELRYILVALGGIAIAALLIHGLWTNRKNRSTPIKEKPLGRVDTRAREERFDDEDVGPVRVVSDRRAEPRMEPEANRVARRAPPIYRQDEEDEGDDLPPLHLDPQHEPEPAPAYARRQSEMAYAAPRHEPAYAGAAQRVPEPAYMDDEEDDEDLVPAPEPVPVRKPSPVIRRTPVRRPQREPVMNAPAAPVAEPEQLHQPEPEIEPIAAPVYAAEAYHEAPREERHQAPQRETVRREEPVLRAEPRFEPEPEPVSRPQVEKIWRDVYVLNLMARPGHQIEGRKLMPALLACGFKFGEMDIFHRHAQADGHGETLFSLINMVNPGTFNPFQMERFVTPGVSLFMQLPLDSNAALVFEEMLRIADQLASDLDVMLTDRERSPLSDETIARCRRELAAYESSRD